MNSLPPVPVQPDLAQRPLAQADLKRPLVKAAPTPPPVAECHWGEGIESIVRRMHS